MNVEVTRAVVTALLDEAARIYPEECCGLLLGELSGRGLSGRGLSGRGLSGGGRIDRAVPTTNVAPERTRHFEIDPAALLAAHKTARGGGPQILGYYHSHPTGQPVPSDVDREHSTGDLRIWAIIGEGRVAFWRDSGNGFSSVICDVIGENRPDSASGSMDAVQVAESSSPPI